MIREQTLLDNDELLSFYSDLGAIPANEVVVLLARRAYCTYRAACQDGAVQLGTRSFGVNTFSSRVLDWQLGWLGGPGTVVHLVDDSINRGAVFRRERQALEAAGCAVIGHVFQSSAEHTPDAGVRYRRTGASPADVRALSEAVYRLIGESGYPYLLDFPLYRESSVTPEAIAGLQTVQGWITHDVTNDSHASGLVRCLSLVPDEVGWQRLEDELPGVSNVAELVKVRIYLRMAGDGRWLARILPKFTLRPHTDEVAQRVTEALRDAMGDAPLRPLVGRDAGRFRLNQFLMSAALGFHFIEQLTQQTLSSLEPSIDIDELRCQLGARAHDQDELVIDAINHCTLGSLADLPTNFTAYPLAVETILGPDDEPVDMPLRQMSKSSAVDRSSGSHAGWEFSLSRAALPFLELTRQFPPAANGDTLYPALSYRRLLASWATLGIGDVATRGAVMLDLLSDRGIAVPVVRETRLSGQKVLSRAYRFGENTSSALDSFVYRDAFEGLCPGASDELLVKLAALASAGSGESVPEIPSGELAEVVRGVGFLDERTGPDTRRVIEVASALISSGDGHLVSDTAVQRAMLERLAVVEADRRGPAERLKWTARFFMAKDDGDRDRQSMAANRLPDWLRNLVLSGGRSWVHTASRTVGESSSEYSHAGIPVAQFAHSRAVTLSQVELERRSLAWLAVGRRDAPAISTLTVRGDGELIDGMSCLLRTLFLQGLESADVERWLSAPLADLGAESPAEYVSVNGVDGRVLAAARRAMNLLGV